MSKRILILGAGLAGSKALQSIHKEFHNDKQTSIMIADRANYSTFSPMLHEVATGSVQPDHIALPIREIINCCLQKFHLGDVQAIDLEQKIVQFDAEKVSYDYLVVALGATSTFFGVSGAEEYAMPLKTMHDAMALRRRLVDTFETATQLATNDPKRKELLHFVIVGGGYTGVETAGQLADLFQNELRDLYPEISAEEAKITLVQGADRVLPILSESSSEKAGQRLKTLGVNLVTGARVTAVTESGVTLNTGQAIPSSSVIWTSGVLAVGGSFFKEDMLEKGRVKVNSQLQMQGFPEVFVIGDIAGVAESGGPHPQTGQVAVQQATIIGRNIKNLIEKKALHTFTYKHKGDLVPIGDRWAIAEIGPLKFSGFIAWWLRRTVYLMGITTWPDRLKIMFTWTMNLFTHRDTTRL